MPSIRYRWSHVISIILLVSVFWTLFYQNTFKIQKNEIFTLFITADYVDSKALENQVQSELTNYGIRKVVIIYISENDTYFTTQLMTRGLFDSDLLILTKSFLNEFRLDEQFKPMDTTSLSSLTWTVHTLDILDQPFALEIYEAEGSNHFGFNSVFDETQDYYVVFNKNTIHEDALIYTALQSILKS